MRSAPLGDAVLDVPLVALLHPVLEPLVALVGRHEVLHLHLFELAGPVDEVAGRDLVAERLADLRDTERRLLARGRLHVLVVDEDALRGLGPQVRDRGGVLDRADVRREHQVELARLGEAAFGAAVRARARLGQVVGAEALVAVLAVDERVGEGRDVAARLPDLRRHEDRGVETDDVAPELHHRTPPRVLDVALEQHTERAVVPGGPEPAVDLRRREHEARAAWPG